MGDKYIIEKHEKDSIWRMYADAYGDVTVEGVNLTPYTEPDTEKVWKEAYDEGYQEGMQLSIDDAKLKEAYQKGLADGRSQDAKDFADMYDSGYSKGLKDAWEAARKISSMDSITRDEVFGLVITSNIFDENTASEAIEKIRQYEQEGKQIQVGDEVLYGNAKGIVIRPEDSTRYASVFTAIGEHISAENKDLTKTGRHFPEIAEVLAKMKEES